MQVRFTPQAEQQYLSTLRRVRAKSPAGVAGIQQRAEAVIAQLRDHPHSGHAIPEFPDLPHRELPVPPYRFFHRVVDDTVWIVAVWHARQLPAEPDDTACLTVLQPAYRPAVDVDVPEVSLIQCVAFDLDGVVIPSQPSFELFESEYGITPEHFREFFCGPYEQAMLGEADLLEVLPATLEQWQWSGTVQGFVRTWFDSCSQAEPAAVDIVRLLQAQGVTCWAASNQDNRRAVYLDSLEWLRMLFDRRFYSCQLGVKKPGADYFNVIQHEAAVSPSAMLLVDDNQENVDGARRCGWCAEVCRGPSDLADIVAAYFPDLASSQGAPSLTG